MAPSPPNLPSEPLVVTLSDSERASGTWSRANMQRAVEAMHRDGLVVFSGIVDPDALEKLRVVMTAESNEIQKLKTNPTQYNHGLMTNFLQAPPLANPALLFPAVYQNPFVVQVAEAYLGPGLCMPFITANTAIKRTTEKQPIHKDTSFVHPSAPFMAISNFLLSDFKPENGSTEFWLGSHNSTLPAEHMWRSPDSVRPTIMIAVAYQASWFPRDNRFKAPESARALLTGNPKVEPLCTFLPDEEWTKISQLWGVGEPMELLYAPKSAEYETISDVAPSDKYINPNFNKFARG